MPAHRRRRERCCRWWFEEEHLAATSGWNDGSDSAGTSRSGKPWKASIWLYEVEAAREPYALMTKYDSSMALSRGMFDEDWARYVMKLATGAGKTKVMSLLDHVELLSQAVRTGFRRFRPISC